MRRFMYVFKLNFYLEESWVFALPLDLHNIDSFKHHGGSEAKAKANQPLHVCSRKRIYVRVVFEIKLGMSKGEIEPPNLDARN